MPGSRLAITMGDPAGIGPEIIAKACRRLQPRLESGELSLTVLGSVAALRAAIALVAAGLEDPEIDAATALASSGEHPGLAVV